MYEINANNNRTFSHASAAVAASVAVAWKRQGLAPKAFHVRDDVEGRVTAPEVAITTVRETARALANA